MPLKNFKNILMAKDALSDIVVPEDYPTVSYDGKSLFTCIPQDLALVSLSG